MGVLDELREAVKKRVRLTKCIDELFDAFEAEHPGLIDETATCDCGKVWPDGDRVHMSYRLKRFVCPACGGGA